MTEIYAVVRRDRARAVREELERSGHSAYSRLPVLGRGRQRGLTSGGAADTPRGLEFLPKMMFHVVVDDEASAEAVEAIVRGGQTGGFGDGRVFVMASATESWRISSGEREVGGEAAS